MIPIVEVDKTLVVLKTYGPTKPVPDRQPGYLTSDVLVTKAAHKQMPSTPNIQLEEGEVSSSSDEDMDGEESGARMDEASVGHKCVTGIAFVPNPTILALSEESELTHLEKYSYDLFITVELEHFRHLLGNNSEKAYGNRTNQNIICWESNMACPMETAPIPELPDSYIGTLKKGEYLGCICPMLTFPTKELYIAHFNMYHIATKISHGYCTGK
jgi:hypothetical protein